MSNKTITNQVVAELTITHRFTASVRQYYKDGSYQSRSVRGVIFQKSGDDCSHEFYWGIFTWSETHAFSAVGYRGRDTSDLAVADLKTFLSQFWDWELTKLKVVAEELCNYEPELF